ncbi:MAG: hypothetical protein Q9219_005336 [cf. Caloplaca sp. 3 TL-2023]
MEELQKKHRQEQKDLQARITQKKKSATKKTRKGVNDECAELERQLRAKQDLEVSKINGQPESDNDALGFNGLTVEDNHNPGVDGNEHERISRDDPMLSVQSKDERTKKPNRQKARLARRAAEQESMVNQAAREAEDLPDLRQREKEAMCAQYTSRGLDEHEIRSDGHCLYAAVADQLASRERGLLPKSLPDDMYSPGESPSPPYKIIRSVAASYIHQYADDFLPFLEEPLDDYLHKIRDTGEWGGHLELLALARAYDVDIHILQSSGQVEKIQPGNGGLKPILWLSYYHHNFGLGEHYNSLRQAG